MAHHDVLALTYRTATASQNALLALSHGVPVLASAVGTFPDQVRDEVDGLLVPPNDREALVAALRHLAEPGVVERLRAEVRAPDLSGPWANYVGGIEALGAAPVGVEPARPVVPLGPVARARATVAGIRARRGPVVDLAPSDVPERVRATDLLAVDGSVPPSFRRLVPVVGWLGPLGFGRSADAFVGQVKAIISADDELAELLTTITVPTLVVVGNQDILTPRGDSEELAELIPTAELVVISGAAHGLMIEHASTFNRVSATFSAAPSAPFRRARGDQLGDLVGGS